MQFLIDGYNLMHFLGLVRPPGPRSLERSRLDFQEWVRKAHGPRVSNVTVVFDGQFRQRPNREVENDHGLRVQFSAGMPADDLIATLIQRERQPQRLTVVSNDRRVQEAARRRQCTVWSCDDYVGWVLDQGLQPPRPPREPEKPPDTEEEKQRWLQEFADIDRDPEVRKFNRMYEDFNQ